MSTIRVDGNTVHVRDADCAFMPCFWTTKRNGRHECGRREQTGCPHPLPAPDPELVRCCAAPAFAKPRVRPMSQRCKACGETVSGRRLELLRALLLAPPAPAPAPAPTPAPEAP